MHEFLAKMAKMVLDGHFQQVLFLELFFYCTQVKATKEGQTGVESRHRENPGVFMADFPFTHTGIWQGSLNQNLVIYKLNIS